MYNFWKRLFDILIALTAVLCLSWLLIPCMLVLLCTGEHYVFYYQKRIGFGGRPFSIIKFATMLLNSPKMTGGTITTRNDPRVLPFGKILRMTKINELPQLFNVLNGTMSIVGPRPLVEEGFRLYSKDVQELIYKIRPGVTGIGSLIFRDEEKYLSGTDDPSSVYRGKIIPYKADLEMWYQMHISSITDLKIIFLTAWLILFPKSNLVWEWFQNLPPRPEWMKNFE